MIYKNYFCVCNSNSLGTNIYFWIGLLLGFIWYIAPLQQTLSCLSTSVTRVQHVNDKPTLVTRWFWKRNLRAKKSLVNLRCQIVSQRGCLVTCRDYPQLSNRVMQIENFHKFSQELFLDAVKQKLHYFCKYYLITQKPQNRAYYSHHSTYMLNQLVGRSLNNNSEVKSQFDS